MSQLANEHNAINLSQGFPNYDVDGQLKQLVSKYLEAGNNQYAPMAGALPLRKAIANKVKLSYQKDVDPGSEIVLPAGATQAIFAAITAFVKPGDEVVVLEPAYDSYIPSIQLNGGIPITYQLAYPDYKVNWNSFSKLINSKTKMIIINTPHNPTGTIFTAEDMKALEDLVQGTDILILSDEVYEHLIYDGEEHQSVLRYDGLRDRSLVTYSFGKTFHCTGWKIGYCIAPESLINEFKKVHQFNVFCVNHPIQLAIADFLETPSNYLGLSNFYQQKRDFLLTQMEGSKFKPLPCRGTYFQLFDYSELSDADELEYAKQLTTEFGVATIPVSPFYTGSNSNNKNNNVLRICFAKTEKLLSEAAQRLNAI